MMNEELRHSSVV